MGPAEWRYADALEDITASVEPLYLTSSTNADDVFTSGALTATSVGSGSPDHYVYDPRDVALAALESTVDPENRTDQRMTLASVGRQLVYHSAPFREHVEIGGFFRLSAWLAIDRP